MSLQFQHKSVAKAKSANPVIQKRQTTSEDYIESETVEEKSMKNKID